MGSSVYTTFLFHDMEVGKPICTWVMVKCHNGEEACISGKLMDATACFVIKSKPTQGCLAINLNSLFSDPDMCSVIDNDRDKGENRGRVWCITGRLLTKQIAPVFQSFQSSRDNCFSGQTYFLDNKIVFQYPEAGKTLSC